MIWSLLFNVLLAAGSPTEALKYLPVQDNGRLKPYDTFARESLEIVYGKDTYEKKPAYEILLTWLLEPTVWERKPIFQISDRMVKQGLRLDLDKTLFTPAEILSSDRLSTLMQELASKRQAKERLNPYMQALQRLESQIFILRAMASGFLLRVVPPTQGDMWVSVSEMNPTQAEAFSHITREFVKALTQKESSDLKKAVEDFKHLARSTNPQLYPSDSDISLEVHYNSFHPFGWAWKSYLLAALCGILIWVFQGGSSSKQWLYRGSWIFSILGMALHIYGFAIRVYLAGRPPVSNMYETVVWVGFGALLFAMIFEALYRWRFVLIAGNVVAVLCMILADRAPTVLDPSLQPLESVLRSSFWLTTHVLTITISYAAFFLSFAVSLMGLFVAARTANLASPDLKAMALATYRGVQVGVALLAPGIILGGIWADYSWGRFWGWDPKETWALIALLGYLALLHAKVAGYIREVGLFASSVVSFGLVIMAWYGVNFVLGAGKHTYGFGAGGVEYVASFVGLSILYTVFCVIYSRRAEV